MKNICIQRVLTVSILMMVFMTFSIALVDKNLTIKNLNKKVAGLSQEKSELQIKIDSLAYVDSTRIAELQVQYDKIYFMNKDILQSMSIKSPKHLKRKIILKSEN